MGTSAAAEVLNSEATGFLKNTRVWGIRKPPGSGRLAHGLFVGRRSSTFKGACEPPSTHPHNPQLWDGFHSSWDNAAVGSKPWGPRDSLQFQEASIGISSHTQTNLSWQPDSRWALDPFASLIPAGSPSQDGPDPLREGQPVPQGALGPRSTSQGLRFLILEMG